MDLLEAITSTGAVRDFTEEPVSDETVYAVLDAARYAPSGGNRQGWRVVLVRDPDIRGALKDLYLRGWEQYLAMAAAGLVPFSPLSDRAVEREALADDERLRAGAAGGFAEHLDTVPVLLVILADLHALAAIDRDLDRYTMTGGASIYPFAWNLLLAARNFDLGGVMTSMITLHEDEARAALGVPDTYAIAAVVALGHPVHRPTALRRSPVESFATVDRFDGPALTT